MPPLGSNESDAEGLALIADWINNHLPAHQSYAEWRLAQFGVPDSPQGEPDIDADEDGFDNQDEYVASTDPLDSARYFQPELNTCTPRVCTRMCM